MYEKIPSELQKLRQWICWHEELINGKKTKVPYNPTTGYHASISDPSTWVDFQTAVAYVEAEEYRGIGMVLTKDCGYVGIDLDNKPENPAPPDDLVLQKQISEVYKDTYSEISPSGRGSHIIIRGTLPCGLDRRHVGIYPFDRYLTFTGRGNGKPIMDGQAMLNSLVQYLAPDLGARAAVAPINGNAVPDAQILETAAHAANADKFIKLYKGQWQEIGEYPSQSEADQALLSMFAFYSHDNAQVLRLFRASALGQRKKAQRDDYLLGTLAKIRANEPPPVDVEAMRKTAEALMVDARKSDDLQKIGFPPGLVGEIARYICDSAPYPMFEAGLAGAITFMAGVTGRAYNIDGMGLNQYVLLIADAGSGKNSASQGIEALLLATRKRPLAEGIGVNVESFMGPRRYASGQGLMQTLSERPSVASFWREFADEMKALNDLRVSPPVRLLKSYLLDLYTNSGGSAIYRVDAHADKQKNFPEIYSPNLSLFTESTAQFFDAITLEDVGSGFLPRFIVLEHDEDTLQIKINPRRGIAPSPDLVERLVKVAQIALARTSGNTNKPAQAVAIAMDADARALLAEFGEQCRVKASAQRQSGAAQLWLRAHEKALKLAGLLGTGLDWIVPVVTLECARWAIAFVTYTTQHLIERFKRGDVGAGEEKQLADLRRLFKEYFSYDAKQLEQYDSTRELQKSGFVPYVYLQRRAYQLAAFKNHPGQKINLEKALDTMVKIDEIGLVDNSLTQKMRKMYFLKRRLW